MEEITFVLHASESTYSLRPMMSNKRTVHSLLSEGLDGRHIDVGPFKVKVMVL